ncbi:unnamed protein product [Eruca vesicaria subsp. sativa]|uniref:Uncharacterized protein n=1 Tax=Eruca vesicaria subsp. sativa TaxID=29727 RepID=A0ABC8LNF8_ERUVS|nr:unnamed protein product [Eruca vesicaria subsp. sativa]
MARKEAWKKMNIAIIYPDFGIERLIVDATIELASQGHKVHGFYRLHAVCAYLRCLFVALCVLLGWSSFDVVLADQIMGSPRRTWCLFFPRSWSDIWSRNLLTS